MKRNNLRRYPLSLILLLLMRFFVKDQPKVSDQIQVWLDRLRDGDEDAMDELIRVTCDRLEILARKMLNTYPRLRQWEQTGDVLSKTAMRLCRALKQVPPATPRDFFGLAATQIRRELIDLTRHYYGRRDKSVPIDENAGPQTPRVPVHQGLLKKDQDGNDQDWQVEDTAGADSPERFAAWEDFHQGVKELPDNEREVVELLWYQDLSQSEAADVVGVDKSTIKRRWKAAKEKLANVLEDWLPKE